MTLHDAARHFRWGAAHDYEQHDMGTKITAIYGLGLYEADLMRLREMVPDLRVTELRRVEHDHGTWLRVDVVERK